MNCSNCKNEIMPNAAFCPTCGARQAQNQPGHNTSATAPRGKSMLMVVGIITTIFGVISLITTGALISNADYWDWMLPIPSGMSWSTYYAVSIVSTLYSLGIGVLAILLCGKLENANMLKILGIISIVRMVAWNIFGAASGATAILGVTGFSMFGMLTSLVLPILYVVGAHKNLVAHRMSQESQQN